MTLPLTIRKRFERDADCKRYDEAKAAALAVKNAKPSE